MPTLYKKQDYLQETSTLTFLTVIVNTICVIKKCSLQHVSNDVTVCFLVGMALESSRNHNAFNLDWHSGRNPTTVNATSK
jgi:hypothetical protein